MAELRRSYLVCATQRSGSTLLCAMLSDTGVAGRPEEYFEAMRDTGVPPHPGDFLDGLARTGLGIRDDPRPPQAPDYSSLVGLGDYRQHLERTLRRGTTPNGVFGAKLMFNQLDELHALAGQLPEFADLPVQAQLDRLLGGPRYVWVSRADTVRQAVSMWKAMQTRRWRAGGDGGAEPAPQYRYEAIDHLVRRFASDAEGWRHYFAGQGIVPLTVGYESELEPDLAGTVRRVLDWIGVTPPGAWAPGEPLRRQADAVTEDWVAAYRRGLAAVR